MKTAKRTLAILLSLTLFLSVIPIAAHAETSESPMDDAAEALEAVA